MAQQTPNGSSDETRILMEQIFWGILGPLVPNVVLMVLIYNREFEGLMLSGVVILYWVFLSGLIGFLVSERARRNQMPGDFAYAVIGAMIGTLVVVLFAHTQWTIFATFQEDPVSAFLFIFLSNLIGTAGALVGYHNARIRALF